MTGEHWLERSDQVISRSKSCKKDIDLLPDWEHIKMDLDQNFDLFSSKKILPKRIWSI